MTAPVFTSSSAVSINEGETAVLTVVANDDADSTTVTYSLKFAGDRAKFVIDKDTGVLQFVAAPDFEAPTDTNKDNVYTVTVIATDGNGEKTEQVINVTVNDVAPVTLTGDELANALGPDDATVDGDTLIGLGGNDTLNGGLGADTMTGGDGDDTYYVDNAGDVVNESLGFGHDKVFSSITYSLAGNNGLNDLELIGTADINATGNGLANIITGNSGKNVIDGGAGADTMAGGGDSDIYYVNSVSDVVTEASGFAAGIADEIRTSVSYIASANVEKLTLLAGAGAINGTGNALNNTITGNESNNTLTGLAGNDTLDGGGGVDVLVGGTGNDTYVVDSTTDTITESLNEGTDTIESSVNYTIASLSNIENLTLTGTTATNAVGNGGDNRITGNSIANALQGRAGNDTINGGAGADTMIGGDGNDTYVVDDANDTITELTGINSGKDVVQTSVTYTLGDNVEYLTMSSSAGAISGTGNELNNRLTGNSFANTLTGLEGNDQLNGGLGNDTMIGGLGNDKYYLNVTGDVVTEGADEGTDTMFVSGPAGSNWTMADNVENLKIQGLVAQNAAGNELDNVMTGNGQANALSGGDGNDTLNGGRGADTMTGGLGDDTFYVDNVGDVVNENPGEGTDLVNATITYTLLDDFENLNLMGSNAINGTGNGLANLITGGAGANVLFGLGGNDTISGGAGNDTIIGGSGADVINGGTGTDTFKFTAIGDSGTAGPAMDSIVNFQSGEKIDLSAIDADAGTAGDQAFVLDTNGTAAAGEVLVSVSGSTATVSVYLNDGDTTADMRFTVTLAAGVTSADMLFLL
jgi:Ca2+-binding RTX toxin-like protein